MFCILAFDTRLKLQHYTVTSDKISAPIRIALLTDLHSCQYGEQQSGLIQGIDSQQPDLIMLGGDICDDVVSNDNTKVLLEGIADRYPCYYVTGNHEYWSGEVEQIEDMIASYGVTILNGTCDTITVNGQNLNICGITDPAVTTYSSSSQSIPEQLQNLQTIHTNGCYSLLLAHRPEAVNLYASYGFDLVLSGHTHGGQWRIPGIVNGLYAPNQGLFPPYGGGKYKIADTVMIVSRGLAKENSRIPRIFNRPELVIVDLNN